jgi:ribosomal-protein-alanine acetyltransferase
MMNLERQSLGAAHWSRELYESLFAGNRARADDPGATSQAGNHEARSEAFVWVVENEAVDPDKSASERWDLLAFLVAHRVGGEWELQNMAVATSVRRNGVGTLLLKKLIAQAGAQRDSKIFLEVRESNQGARTLYEKVGFEKTGVRKDYYSDPAENAILYQLTGSHSGERQ